MGRKLKATDEEKISIVNGCVMTKLNGDPSKLTFVRAAEYAQELGYDLKEYDFRHSGTVVSHVDALKKGNVRLNDLYVLPPYKQMDMDSWLKLVKMDSSTMAAMLEELNEKCAKYSGALFQIQTRFDILDRKLAMMEQDTVLRSREQTVWGHSPQPESCEKSCDKVSAMEEELKSYRRFVHDYCLQDVASSFLNETERKKWTFGTHVLDPVAMEKLIEPKKPTPVPYDDLKARMPKMSQESDNGQTDSENKAGAADNNRQPLPNPPDSSPERSHLLKFLRRMRGAARSTVENESAEEVEETENEYARK